MPTSQSQTPAFPAGEFAAFSTAKMSYFLPVREGLTQADIDHFFGADASHVTLTAEAAVELQLPNATPQTARPGQLVARFSNGKYKVMDADYYAKNFNDPLTDADNRGIY